MVGVTEKETKDRVIWGPTTLGDLRREQPKTEREKMCSSGLLLSYLALKLPTLVWSNSLLLCNS